MLLASCLAAACWRPAPQPAPFDVARTSPALSGDAEPLLLNDPITLYFTESVQPLSVTTESVQILDDQGHPVPGTLRVGTNWVTFQPVTPVLADLSDGSFRPGATYHLHVAGSPRPDAVLAGDGRRLTAMRSFPIRVADRGYRPAGLAAPLRPPASDLPFLMRTEMQASEVVPADVPRLRLHFTLPVLPSSVTVDCFTVMLGPDSERLRPRSVRVVRSRLDEFEGSTVEIDLGSLPRSESGTGVTLDSGLLSVALSPQSTLTDYSGNHPLPSPPLFWSVVPGSTVALAEWPGPGEGVVAEVDAIAPAFEVRAGAIRPRVRVEAGDGSLGVFRPTRNTVLRPGVPFDRGDGQSVVSRGSEFPFLAVDIAPGIEVTIDAAAQAVHLLACGSMRIDGSLAILGGTAPMSTRGIGAIAAAAELLAGSRAALFAAGDVSLAGPIRSDAAPGQGSPLLVASAGRIRLAGELPFNTLLAFEEGEGRAIVGPRGQAIPVQAVFTFGVAPGADFTVRGSTEWRSIPRDRDSGVVRVAVSDDALQVAWQCVAPNAVRGGPDPREGTLPRPQRAFDRDVIALPAGGWVRFQLECRAAPGSALPTLDELRIVDR